MAAVKKNKKNPNGSPKAWEFVLVKDEKGEFKYYYQGKFYTYEQVTSLLSPKEAKKLARKVEAEKKVEEKKEEEIKAEIPPEKKDLEQKMLEDVARKIINEIRPTLGRFDEDKLIKIIISRLRGVRKDVEMKYILTASFSAGGIGFDEQRAEVVIETTKKYLSEVEKKRLKIIRGEEIEITEPIANPQMPAPKETAPPIARKKLSGLDEKKPVVSDVTRGAGLIGPVDELRTMDLVNLRRLGTNKEEIVSEILERISLLEEQSVQKKVDGINAWQQSPVYQMYLNLGYQSIKENRPVEQIINEKLERGEKVMNFEEFSALMEINSKVQF